MWPLSCPRKRGRRWSRVCHATPAIEPHTTMALGRHPATVSVGTLATTRAGGRCPDRRWLTAQCLLCGVPRLRLDRGFGLLRDRVMRRAGTGCAPLACAKWCVTRWGVFGLGRRPRRLPDFLRRLGVDEVGVRFRRARQACGRRHSGLVLLWYMVRSSMEFLRNETRADVGRQAEFFQCPQAMSKSRKFGQTRDTFSEFLAHNLPKSATTFGHFGPESTTTFDPVRGVDFDRSPSLALGLEQASLG